MLIAAFTLIALARAQDSLPSFEVASLKESGPLSAGVKLQFGQRVSPDRVQYRAPLSGLLQVAFDVPGPQLKAPQWVAGSPLTYSIEAKVDPATPNSQLPLMLRSLLIERFHLTYYVDEKELPGYDLIVSHKRLDAFRETDDAKSFRIQNGPGHASFSATTMSQFAAHLSGITKKHVADRTGMIGMFDFSLDWEPYDDAERATANRLRSKEYPDPLTAIQEQLGLKAIPTKSKLRIVVIDHLDKSPIQN